MDRVPGQVVNLKGFPPDRAVDGRLALAAKVNLLSALLNQHGIAAPYEVVAPSMATPLASTDMQTETAAGRSTELMDLPNELLLRICRVVIYNTEKPRTGRTPAAMVCAGKAEHLLAATGPQQLMKIQTYPTHEGVLLVAYVAYRLSANTRLRRVALDELFSNMVFSLRFSSNFVEPQADLLHRKVFPPYWYRDGRIRLLQDNVQPLIDQITRIEIALRPTDATYDLKKDQTHLCLKGIATELSWVPTILPHLKHIHVSTDERSKTIDQYTMNAFIWDVVSNMRGWKGIERRSISFRSLAPANRFLDCEALRPETVAEWMRSTEEDAVFVI